jgi:hypothetical protein
MLENIKWQKEREENAKGIWILRISEAVMKSRDDPGALKAI